jgi:hypothetical protein
VLPLRGGGIVPARRAAARDTQGRLRVHELTFCGAIQFAPAIERAIKPGRCIGDRCAEPCLRIPPGICTAPEPARPFTSMYRLSLSELALA